MQNIHEKLARCSTVDEIKRMLDGNGYSLIETRPIDAVADTLPLVLYFGNEDDREEFVQVVLAAKPGMRVFKV